MLISKLKDLNWTPYMISRSSPDTGLLVLSYKDKKDKNATTLYIEFGWYVLLNQHDKARLVVNKKHEVKHNFPLEVDPENPIQVHAAIELLPWRDFVAKTLPEDTFK